MPVGVDANRTCAFGDQARFETEDGVVPPLAPAAIQAGRQAADYIFADRPMDNSAH